MECSPVPASAASTENALATQPNDRAVVRHCEPSTETRIVAYGIAHDFIASQYSLRLWLDMQRSAALLCGC